MTEVVNALQIQSGYELSRFNLGVITIKSVTYQKLTGFESTDDICWWCGKLIIPNPHHAHYCRVRSHDDFESCFLLYHKHFDWSYASRWALRRAGRKCQNCGINAMNIGRFNRHSNLEVHHIVPLKGSLRSFTAYNLPWNLIVLCHTCHLELHAAMKLKPEITIGEMSQMRLLV